MPLKYSLKKMGKNLKKEGPDKYYAVPKSDGIFDLDAVSERINAISTVSSVDTVAVVEAFIKVVSDALLDGKSVKLGKFGIFSLSIRSEGVEDKNNFSLKNIIQFKINFLPSTKFKRLIKKIKLTHQKQYDDE
ncbi:MAG: HU family DNA-binding protein [Candidatus Cloacimonetes bacterium]|nr:HU family DNA-binding protein [Candidatus Cloacimonadota bacterium]